MLDILDMLEMKELVDFTTGTSYRERYNVHYCETVPHCITMSHHTRYRYSVQYQQILMQDIPSDTM